jgi:flagellin-like protein
MRYKRGISNIVSTLLIVLLVIVAVGVVWVAVSGLLKSGAEDLEGSSAGFSIDLEISKATLDGSMINVKVRRNPGEGNLKGIKYIFYDGTNEKTSDKEVDLEIYGTASFDFDLSELGVPNAYKVSVAPIYETSSGDKVGNVVDSLTFSAAPSEGEEPEEPVGDGVVCGDGIVNGSEVCDGVNLTGETCVTQGFLSGTLLCSSNCLSFNLSGCLESGGTCTNGEQQSCAVQLGVCAGANQTCTDETWPGCNDTTYLEYNSSYESSLELSCDDGLDNDCDGLVDYDDDDCELTWDGTIKNSWPSETKMYIEILEQIPFNDVGLFSRPVGKYLEITSGIEDGICVQIYDYVYPADPEVYNYSILRLDETSGPYFFNVGDTFTIWDESVTCGA